MMRLIGSIGLVLLLLAFTIFRLTRISLAQS